MSTPPSKLFPGQVQTDTFTTDQVKLLSAVARSEVFWAFSPDEPRSASDVARETGKSAPSVHYHVQGLVDVGLLIPAATRKRRSRTETLYVHAAKSFMSQGVTAPKEYREFSHKTFAAMSRSLANDNAALHRVVDEHPEIAQFYNLNRTGLRMTLAQFQEFKKRMGEFTASIEQSDDDEAERLNLFFVVAPSMATCKTWAKRHKKS